MKIRSIKALLIFIILINLLLSGILINLNEKYNKVPYNFKPLLSDIVIGNYTVPGVSGLIPTSQIIKIGLLNDIGHFSGDNSLEGATLAAKEINKKGGLLLNGTQYYIGIASEDTDEGDDSLNTSIAMSAADRMMNFDNPYYIIGGYRTEAVLAYIDDIIDAKIPFLCTGVSEDLLTERVENDYNRYKYFFRMLSNSSASGIDLIQGISYYATLLNHTYPNQIGKIGIFYENLEKYNNLVTALNYYIPVLTNFTIPSSSVISFDPGATYAEISTDMEQFEIDGCDIVIPLISGSGGIYMNNWYASNEPNYILIGSNLLSTLDTQWINTNGNCKYEIGIDNFHRTNKTTKSVAFWDSFNTAYGHNPFYTAVNSYDAIYTITWVINETNSFDPEPFISQMEALVPGNDLIGASNHIAFTTNHGLVSGYPYTASLWTQWQEGGSKVVLSHDPNSYPKNIATGYMRIPPWILTNWSITPEIPGSFNLSYNFSISDNSVIFNLTWTLSSGADNYSLYYSNTPITVLSRCSVLVDELSATNFTASGLPNGDHYFIILAHGKDADTLSNKIQIINPLAPGSFILNSNASIPDMDGNFNLTWTPSSGADNYSIYTSLISITEINDNASLISYQNATSPHFISNFPNGNHFFVVVAYNETGETLSNLINITVQVPPGPFTLNSNASTPDTDGNFNLTWTFSSGADNYSIYSSNTSIIEIDGNVSLISYQNATSPHEISEFPSGDHYFVIVAYNEFGETLSNSIPILINRLPSCNKPSNINTNLTGTETIDWRLFDDLNGGQYRVLVNDTDGKYYVWQDWQSWINGTNLQVPINRAKMGIFSYSIEYYDNIMQYGASDTVIANISGTYIPPGIKIPFDLISKAKLYFEITTINSAYFQITISETIFPEINAISSSITPLCFYSFEIFNLAMIEDKSMIQDLMIRFYYNPLEVKNPNNLRLYHYNEILGTWDLEETTLNNTQNFIELETTSLSYFCIAEVSSSSPPSDFPIFIIIIIIILSITGVSIPTAYIKLTKNKQKGEIKQKKKKKSGYEKEVYQQKGDYKLPKKVKTEPKDKMIESIISKELQEIKETRKEMQIEENEDICQVHRGTIKGMIYSCPKCKTKYCLKCVKVLIEKGECCWVCNTNMSLDGSIDSNIKTIMKEDTWNSNILKALENEAYIEELNRIDITLMDRDFWSKITELNFNDEDKNEFIKTMLSLNPNEQKKVINKILELQINDDDNPIV